MAGKTASTWKQLEEMLLLKIQNAMVKEGEFLKEKVEGNVDKMVYDAYNPKEYERTGQLKNSLFTKTPKIKNKTVEVEVKHDTDKIDSIAPNQHYSVVEKYPRKDVSDWIPYLVISGKTHPLWGEGVFTEPRDYIEKTKTELEGSKEHVDELVKNLIAEGLDARKG